MSSCRVQGCSTLITPAYLGLTARHKPPAQVQDPLVQDLLVTKHKIRNLAFEGLRTGRGELSFNVLLLRYYL